MMNTGKEYFIKYARKSPFKETIDHGTIYFHPRESDYHEWVACITDTSALIAHEMHVEGSYPRIETRNANSCYEFQRFKDTMDHMTENYYLAQKEYEKRMNKYKETQIRKAAEKFCE